MTTFPDKFLRLGFFLAGDVIAGGEVAEVRSPYDGEVVGSTYLASASQVELAIAAASRAFLVTRKMAAYERSRILQTVSAEIARRRDEFALLLALEAGKPLKAGRAEVDRAIFTFHLAGEEASRVYGEYMPLDRQPATASRWGLVRRFPVGPVAAITPFNFPLNLVAHKLAPAIACGCPVVLKPAPQTPLTALLLAEIIAGAGWPTGALSVLPLSNENAGLLVGEERFNLLSFTGSAAVGWGLKARAGKQKVALELGGNGGVIIHSDANIEFAAERCVAGGFGFAGQSCISVQRVLVQSSVMEKFLAAFIPAVRRLKCGDPRDEEVDVGPMIRRTDAERAEQWVAEAVSGGARLLCGGSRTESVMQPVVLTGTRPEMRVNCEEIFAPVVTVESYENFSAAIARLNDSRYGLQAGLFTRDARLIFQAYEELDVGGVMVGEVPTFRADEMPYGGVKDSGLGREGVRYAMQEMSERKILVMNLG